MKKVSVLVVLCLALASCGGKRTPVSPPLATPVDPRIATVLGGIVPDAWYMVVKSSQPVPPLVIRVDERAKCRADVDDFNLKSVAPGGKGEPAKAWCAQGQELQQQLRLSGANTAAK